MSWNVPDDWNSYYRNCGSCGTRYHASEGGCECETRRDDEAQRCAYYEDAIENMIGVTLPKGRTSRSCCGCGDSIPKGAVYARVCSKGPDGKLWTTPMHVNCWTAGEPRAADDDDGWSGPDEDDRYDADYLADRAADRYEAQMDSRY